MKVSIIVTIYNVAEYLEKSIRSIMNQTYQEIEIILVDDGSTDNSGLLSEKLAREDARIIVIHKLNGGTVSARKAGLECAKGEYVLFVDADDWLDKHTIDFLVSMAKKERADVVTMSWVIHDGNSEGTQAESMPAGTYCEKENMVFFASHMIYFEGSRNGINGSLSTKLIRRELLQEILTQFPDDVRYAEDDFVAYACCAKAGKVTVTHEPFYHYVMRYTSVSHTKNSNYLQDLNKGYQFFIELLHDSRNYLLYKKQIEMFILRAVFLGVGKYMGFEKELSIPWYTFNADIIPKDSRIALYGAGKVGQSFYKQFVNNDTYFLVAWVDRQYEKYQNEGYLVQAPDILSEVEVDYIVLCIDNELIAKQIRMELVKRYGFESNKIIWQKPVNLLDQLISE